jgi:hypothetical protein
MKFKPSALIQKVLKSLKTKISMRQNPLMLMNSKKTYYGD